jgi:DNA-directed RNA polymerase
MDVTLETDQDLIDHQLQLETDMITGGIERFRKERDASIERGRESHTLHGRVIVSRLVDDVALGIEEWIKTPSNVSRDIAWKKVKDCNAEQLSFLSLVTLVDSISRKNTLMYVARSIGASIEIQDRLDRWIADEGDIARNTIKQAMKKAYGARRYGLTNKMNKDGYKENAWLQSERIHVGFKMVDIIIRSTGIVKLSTQQAKRGRKTTWVVPEMETLDWINSFNSFAETHRPRLLPCVIVPKDWTDVTGGGYHGHEINKLPIVRRR